MKKMPLHASDFSSLCRHTWEKKQKKRKERKGSVIILKLIS